MRTRFLPMLSAAAVTMAMAALSRPAEAADIRCQVPFSFTIRDATLPPGEYLMSIESGVLFVRGVHQGVFALTVGESGPDDHAKAVFDKNGDQYLLREVWTGGGDGHEVLEPKPPREQSRSDRRESDARAVERVTIPAL
jgi:hypothetical protein